MACCGIVRRAILSFPTAARKVAGWMLADVAERFAQCGRAVFCGDGMELVLYRNEADQSIVLEERGYGTICVAYSLDEALMCVEDHVGFEDVTLQDDEE